MTENKPEATSTRTEMPLQKCVKEGSSCDCLTVCKYGLPHETMMNEMQKEAEFEHEVDRRAQEMIEANPGSALTASYRAVAMQLYAMIPAASVQQEPLSAALQEIKSIAEWHDRTYSQGFRQIVELARNALTSPAAPRTQSREPQEDVIDVLGSVEYWIAKWVHADSEENWKELKKVGEKAAELVSKYRSGAAQPQPAPRPPVNELADFLWSIHHKSLTSNELATMIVQQFFTTNPAQKEEPTQAEKALLIALDSFAPISEFLSEVADEYDDGGEPEYGSHPMNQKARDCDAHISGTIIAIEQALGGDPMAGPKKIDELRARVPAPAITDEEK